VAATLCARVSAAVVRRASSSTFSRTGSAAFGSLANILRGRFTGAEPNVKIEFVFRGVSGARSRDGGILPDQHARAAQPAKWRLIGRKLLEVENIGLRYLQPATHIERRIDEPMALPRAAAYQAGQRKNSSGTVTGTTL
jgi:hypothetical protein